jgi:hypothetical protein
MKSVWLLIVSVCASPFFSGPLWAQTPFLPALELPVPQSVHFAELKPNKIKSVAVDVDALADTLDQQFQASLAVLNRPEPDCSDASQETLARNYVLALQISGQLEACSEFARRCNIGPQVLATGAACELGQNHFSEAYALLTLAKDAKYRTSPDYDAVLVQLAVFKFGNVGEDPDISLSLSPNFSTDTKKLLKHVILELGRYKDDSMTPEETLSLLRQEIARDRSYLGDLLKFFLIRFEVIKYLREESVNDLALYAPTVSNPLLWYDLAYVTLYHGLDQNFALAQKIYDVYDQYSHPWWNFPTEQNTYNYTEIYSKVCTAKLLQGREASQLETIKDDWRSGKASLEQSLSSAESLNASAPGKADVLSTYGSFLAMADRHPEARSAYWQAHRACRYFNRANWGLVLEARYQRFVHSPNYARNAANIERELAGVVIPDSIRQFILNWTALSPDAQRRVEYGSRIWLPYVDTLSRNSFSAYIKLASELLSEAPGMSDVRDQRIGGANYPNDNRLWDDVRGLGGENVIADLSEVYQTVQGDYNLLGHEMGHQFQYLMEKLYPQGVACIQKLYSDTQMRGTFPDGYSAQNKEEHFAQGVTYYLIPEDAPSNFGTSRAWLKAYAPKQLQFIESIRQAQGDLSKISCPL